MKRAIVTGGAGAIGTAIVKNLVSAAYIVTIISRDARNGELAINNILKQIPKAQINFISLDLSDHQSIKQLAQNWKEPLDLLMNVASQTPRKREETNTGIEKQFATNVLGYYWMINEFAPFMKPNSRIVNVASYWAGDLDLTDLEFKRRQYDNDTAYRQSKQCERMLTIYFAETLREKGIAVNSCHPGDVNSKLSNDLGFGGYETPEQGAETPTYVAISNEVEGVTGKYFQSKSARNDKFDKDAIAELVRQCASY
ncbi:retinol dehydrogenase [Histomonas meleagridis]|uniref:retinol dehydrogenase n=1 Tax=Histomonas meleagridis TaxID=135588 RepID=UPI00355A3104|nr:retinol dehydrogenase [Histomonas meleagridis]KAH0802342.1 retinol dehydrogenase [Histomonas meleagridis]